MNVHPAKREVRFREPDLVRNSVAETIRKTLEADRRRWTHSFDKPREAAKAPVHLPMIDPTPPLIPPAEQFALRRDWADFHSVPVKTAPRPVDLPVPVEPCQPVTGIPLPNDRPESRSEFKILGILGKLYILMENSRGACPRRSTRSS